MNMNHLTDCQVQAIAFADKSDLANSQPHLTGCLYCQQRVRQYHLLAKELSQLSPLPQDEALADAVLERLALPRPKSLSVWPERMVWVACLGLILALVSAYLLVPIQSMLTTEAVSAVSVVALISGLLVGVQWLENRLNKAQVVRQFFLPPTGATF